MVQQLSSVIRDRDILSSSLVSSSILDFPIGQSSTGIAARYVHRRKPNVRVQDMLFSVGFLWTVINHQSYNEKADAFSFAIVLWELVTAKVPYDTLTPLQAALGERKGLRPELPKDGHPKLIQLMQRCWDAYPFSC